MPRRAPFTQANVQRVRRAGTLYSAGCGTRAATRLRPKERTTV